MICFVPLATFLVFFRTVATACIVWMSELLIPLESFEMLILHLSPFELLVLGQVPTATQVCNPDFSYSRACSTLWGTHLSWWLVRFLPVFILLLCSLFLLVLQPNTDAVLQHRCRGTAGHRATCARQAMLNAMLYAFCDASHSLWQAVSPGQAAVMSWGLEDLWRLRSCFTAAIQLRSMPDEINCARRFIQITGFLLLL